MTARIDRRCSQIIRHHETNDRSKSLEQIENVCQLTLFSARNVLMALKKIPNRLLRSATRASYCNSAAPQVCRRVPRRVGAINDELGIRVALQQQQRLPCKAGSTNSWMLDLCRCFARRVNSAFARLHGVADGATEFSFKPLLSARDRTAESSRTAHDRAVFESREAIRSNERNRIRYKIPNRFRRSATRASSFNSASASFPLATTDPR